MKGIIYLTIILAFTLTGCKKDCDCLSCKNRKYGTYSVVEHFPFPMATVYFDGNFKKFLASEDAFSEDAFIGPHTLTIEYRDSNTGELDTTINVPLTIVACDTVYYEIN